MDLETIKRKYPNQWVLIEYDSLDDFLKPRGGYVIAHSFNKEEVYSALTKTFGQNVAIEYTGSHQEELTVMFFLA